MNAPARTPTAGSPAFTITERPFQLIDDERSAAIENYRFALLSLSELACDDVVAGEDGSVSLSRPRLQALFITLERSLGNLVGPDALPTAWLPDAVFTKGAEM